MIDASSQNQSRPTAPLFEGAKTGASLSQEMQDMFAQQLSKVEATQALAQKAEDRAESVQDNSTGFALLEKNLPKPQTTPQREETQKVKGRFSYSSTNLNQRQISSDTDAGIKIARSYRMESAEKATKVREITDFTWDDFLDLINPLQHIPVVNEIYRSVTGDEIKPSVQVAGSLAFGAVTGSLVISAATGIAEAMYEENAGGVSPLQQVASLFMGEDETQTTQTAQQAAPIKEGSPEVQTANASSAAQTEKLKEEIAQKAVLRAKAVLAQMPGDESLASLVSGSRKTKTHHTSKARGTLSLDGALTAHQKTTGRGTTEAAAQKISDQEMVALMQKQAQAKAAGEDGQTALIPELMFQALDKYQKAAALTVQ